MATDREDNAQAAKGKTPSQQQSTTPPGPSEAPWIMHNLNLIREQINSVEERIREQINSVEERIQEQINGLETRLRRIERLFWVGQGILIAILVVWAVVQFLVSNYQISFTPNP